ncbi:MAG: phospho-N-acetylmuramoyl-pentapeptide-transferase [Candidatus Colwellbacteria bacterium]|nr:phospho-N-acetylmuramoyl-pentapeptide-transferase [Candidatus Colwellbacteria bacterium]
MVIEAIKILFVSIFSFIVAILLTPVMMKALLRFGIKKQIRTSESAPIFSALHSKKAGTPTMGGIIIWGTVLFVAVLMAALSNIFSGIGVFDHLNFISRSETYLPLAAMVFAALFGLIDDILGVFRIGPKGGGLAIKHKLIVYALLGSLGAWWFYSPTHLDWHVLTIPFLGNIDIGAWYIPIFMFIIIASAFSANETDGLDGLLGGVSMFAFGALGVIAIVLGRFDLAAMCGAIVGALLAFLWNNVFPAKFFMGDTGSMALGITMGVIAMLTNTTLLLPFFAAVMVIESLSVIVQKIYKKMTGKKLFLSTPIHHHFEAKGMPESQITMRLWIISWMFAGLGVIVFFLSRLV